MESFLKNYMNFYKQEVVVDAGEECEEDPEVIKQNLLTRYDFKLPIEYHDSQCLNETVLSDIEFQKKDEGNLFHHLLKSPQSHEPLLIQKWSSLYSTKKDFLKDNQNLLKQYVPKETKMDSFVSSYLNFKGEQNFLSKYQYIQFRRFFFLNSMIGFLQCLAIYNLCSPLLSLLSPIIGLIIPYFIFYFKGIKIGFSNYVQMMKKMILSSNVIKNLLNFRTGTMQQKLYTFMYIFFYVLGLYNNVNSCIHFYKNTNFLIDFNSEYYNYLCEGTQLIDHIHDQTKTLNQFSEFNETMVAYRSNIQNMKHTIQGINQCKEKLIKCGQIGLLLKYNFDIFHNEQYHDTIMYLIYLHQYHINMSSISSFVQKKKLKGCSFSSSKPTKLKQMYYLGHIHEKPIKNSVKLDKNIIITGPNASGKTTIIKSTIINLFLSQSLGVGCYKSCTVNPYTFFHSYLNIPDTSNRDSLFQAEARRCKDIFTFIKENSDKRHLCIFDEIYSGTNPEDAVLCATNYLTGMNTYKSSVDYVLTTHYLGLCKEFEKKEQIKNQQMCVKESSENIEYTYILKDGISDIHGGYQVLRNLDYPAELL